MYFKYILVCLFFTRGMVLIKQLNIRPKISTKYAFTDIYIARNVDSL